MIIIFKNKTYYSQTTIKFINCSECEHKHWKVFRKMEIDMPMANNSNLYD
jgi:hypothetical protein